MRWLDGITHHPRGPDGHEFEQILGDNEGQGNLECRQSMGSQTDMTERLNKCQVVCLSDPRGCTGTS